MKRNIERNKKALELRKSGKKLVEIAEELNLCPQRVSQLCASETALAEIRSDEFYSLVVDDEMNKIAIRCYTILTKAGITNEVELKRRWDEVANAEIPRIGQTTVQYLTNRLNELGILEDVRKIG